MAKNRETPAAPAEATGNSPTAGQESNGLLAHPNLHETADPGPGKPKKVPLNSSIVQLVGRLDRILNKEDPAKRVAVLRFLAEAHGLTVVE